MGRISAETPDRAEHVGPPPAATLRSLANRAAKLICHLVSVALATCVLISWRISGGAPPPHCSKLPRLAVITIAGFASASYAQTQSPQGPFRGGNDLVGQGRIVSNTCLEVGSAVYKALKDGYPYANEAKMPNDGIPEPARTHEWTTMAGILVDGKRVAIASDIAVNAEIITGE